MTLLRDAILDHIQAMSFDRLPSDVVAKTSALVADGLASALIGSADSNAKTFRDIQLTHYGFGGVPVWGTDDMWGTDHLLGWIGAGMVNGFHCHVSHCAGVHDATQIEAAPVIVPAVMAYADRFGQIPGKDIITAVNIGVDVSVLLAHASAKKERFDRSSMCGVLGAGVALAKLEQMDRPTTAEFLGLIYNQLAGPVLPDTAADLGPSLQIAFAVRNVLTAFDFMRQYLTGPADVLDGPGGYFEVFERGGDAAPFLDGLGTLWRTEEVMFKPAASKPGDDPITGTQLSDKFTHCALSAAQPLSREIAERLYARLQALEDEKDVSVLSALASGVDLEKEIV